MVERIKPEKFRATDEGYDERTELMARIKIDKNALDDNAVEQPELFFRCAEQLELAISRRDRLKYDLDLLTAKIDCDIRARYEKQEKKFTEKSVSSEVEADVDIIDLKRKLLDAGQDVGKWRALREALEQRRDMLKVEANLYVGNYFTRTSVSATISSVSDMDADRVRKAGGAERRSRMKE